MHILKIIRHHKSKRKKNSNKKEKINKMYEKKINLLPFALPKIAKNPITISTTTPCLPSLTISGVGWLCFSRVFILTNLIIIPSRLMTDPLQK
jgi:hypothetical protein